MHYGNWPQHIDHINGDRLDNRIENLREVDRAENMKNMRMPADNTSGFVGVTRHYEKWKAQITVNGKHIYLGRFDHKKDAIAARIAANRKFGFHENHGSRA